MSKVHLIPVPPRPIPKFEERLHFVRQVGRRRYYIDLQNREQEEFYILDSSQTLVQEHSDDELVEPTLYTEHPKFPKFGPYWKDKDGRDVFVGHGRPFYVGMFEGKEHKIFLGASRDERMIRSRARVPSAAMLSENGTHRIGGFGVGA